jgi:glutamate synthase (NADPH/NADH) small chain
VKPPETRSSKQPWPTYPNLYEVSSAHEEFGERRFMSSTVEFLGESGLVKGIRVADTQIVDGKRVPTPGTERTIEADLVLLALGFVGPETAGPVKELNLGLELNSTFARADDFSTEVPGLFVAGDAGRGQSLIVWAIAEGRAAAATIDRFLEGTTDLPSPVRASDQPLSVYS